MLVQFRVENHRSLRDEQVLSMVAADGADKDAPWLIRPAGLSEALLPALALYGANASGKSNLVGALGFMREAVLRSHRYWNPESGTPQEPFALSGKAGQPSVYEVDILLSGVRYRYGFVISSKCVDEEWLYAWPHGKKQTWFAREGEQYEFGRHLHGENEVIKGLCRPNSLFLSTAAQNNHSQILPIFAWFLDSRFESRRGPIRAMDPVQTEMLGNLFGKYRQLSLFQDDNEAYEHDRKAIVRLLQAADIGILDIRAAKLEEMRRQQGGFRSYASKVYEFFFLHKSQSKKGVWLPLDSESAGTITLFGIAARLVGVLREGGLLCIDELEASLHPMLALEIVRIFNSRHHNPKGAQLIFTTHDTNLLGNVLGETPLRRDQIWFTEKDATGATKLYPLTDFHPRKQENLERGYLQGRYGAIPFLGELTEGVETPEGE